MIETLMCLAFCTAVAGSTQVVVKIKVRINPKTKSRSPRGKRKKLK